MDLIEAISRARAGLQALPAALPWQPSLLRQLDYCAAVLRGEAGPAQLEQLTMAQIAVRELEEAAQPDGTPTLGELLGLIQYELQQAHLPYAAKVRLGIHRRS